MFKQDPKTRGLQYRSTDWFIQIKSIELNIIYWNHTNKLYQSKLTNLKKMKRHYFDELSKISIVMFKFKSFKQCLLLLILIQNNSCRFFREISLENLNNLLFFFDRWLNYELFHLQNLSPRFLLVVCVCECVRDGALRISFLQTFRASKPVL